MPGETSAFTEAMSESRVVKGVRGAIEGVQQGNKEYWEIRKSIDERLKWHGGGLYRAHVDRMDAIITALHGKKDAGFFDKVAYYAGKFAVRLEGRMLQLATILPDLVWNFWTWPIRKVLPFPPKSPFKRLALGYSLWRVTGYGIGVGGLKAEMAGVKGVRKGVAAAVAAPEVAATMLKRRVDYFVDQIKNPHPIGIETKPNKPFKPK